MVDVIFSASPFGTGDLKIATNIGITSGTGTLSVAQTGNIGIGDRIDYNSISISAFADGGGGTVDVTTTSAHGMTTDDYVFISGTANYNGTFKIAAASGSVFTITATWVSDDGTGTVRNIAYISVLNSATSVDLINPVGGTTQDITSGITVDKICHEYASLSEFSAGFTDANHINNTDLTATGANVIVKAACYYDHAADAADTAAVNFAWGGTTDATHYLEVFTPTGGTESINNQRHAGVYTTNMWRLEPAVQPSSVGGIHAEENYTRLIGLATKNTYTGDSTNRYGIKLDGLGCIVHDAIILGTDTGLGSRGLYILNVGATGIKVWNIVIYNCPKTGLSNAGPNGGTNNEFSNITVANCGTGFEGNASYKDLGLAKNCIAIACTTGWAATWHVSCSNNASYDSTHPGSSGVSLSSDTITDYFTSTSDLHINDAATYANEIEGAGVSVSDFTDDIDGETRSTWDIGADEYISAGATYNESAIDGLNVGDSSAGTAVLNCAANDGLNVGDSSAGTAVLNCAANDGLNMGDQPDGAVTFPAAITDGIRFSDTAGASCTFFVAAADGINFNDTIAVITQFAVLVTDGFTTGDMSTTPLPGGGTGITITAANRTFHFNVKNKIYNYF